MMRLWKDNAGETLIEALVGVLIIVLSLTMLAVSIVAAANVNEKANQLDTSFVTTTSAGDNVKKVSDVTVTLTNGTGTTPVVVDGYETTDDNEYAYYTERTS